MTPVSVSVQEPSGSGSTVLPQPVSASRTVQRVTATTMSVAAAERHHVVAGVSVGEHRNVVAAQEGVRTGSGAAEAPW